MYYNSLTGTKYTGFSDHMVTLTNHSQGYGDYGRRLLETEEEANSFQACEQLLSEWKVPFYRGFTSCCATFILPGERLLLHPEGLYLALRGLMLNETLDDEATGRGCFEYLIWYMFREPPQTEQMSAYYEMSYSIANDMGDRLRICESDEPC